MACRTVSFATTLDTNIYYPWNLFNSVVIGLHEELFVATFRYESVSSGFDWKMGTQHACADDFLEYANEVSIIGNEDP